MYSFFISSAAFAGLNIFFLFKFIQVHNFIPIEWIISRIRPLLLFGIIDERKFVNEVSQNVKFTFIIYASHYLIIDILFKFVFDRLNFINNYFVCIFLPLIIAAIVYFINYLLYSIIKKIKFKDKIFLLIAGGRG